MTHNLTEHQLSAITQQLGYPEVHQLVEEVRSLRAEVERMKADKHALCEVLAHKNSDKPMQILEAENATLRTQHGKWADRVVGVELESKALRARCEALKELVKDAWDEARFPRGDWNVTETTITKVTFEESNSAKRLRAIMGEKEGEG